MASNLGVVSQVFERTLDDMPYSSAMSMYLVAGKKPTRNYGGNCIEQNRILQRRLADAEFHDAVLLRDRLHGRHHPLLLRMDNALFYSDVYLMSYTPINLSEILDTEGKCGAFDAYPSIGDKKSRLTISFDPSGRRFRIHKTWPGSARTDEFEYDFDSVDNRMPTPEEYKPLIFDPVQTSLSVRSLDVAAKRCDHLVYPVNGKVKTFDGLKLFMSTNEGKNISLIGNPERFKTALERMVEHVGGSVDEILRFMAKSVELYVEHHP